MKRSTLGLKAALRCVAWSLALGLWWGLAEAAYLFFVRFHFHDQVIRLFTTGAVYYTTYGLLLGLASLPLIFVWALFQRTDRLLTPAFLVTLAVVGLAVATLIKTIRTQFFFGLPRTDVRVLATNVGIVLVCGLAGLLVYRLVVRLWTSVRDRSILKIGAGALRVRTLVPALILGLPVLLVVGGWVRGLTGEPPVASPLFDPVERRGTETDDSRPNVLLITLETTRADHLNAFGYRVRTTSPNIDALAAQGAMFTGLRSTSSWTLPSMASLFTSLYPSQHGMRGEIKRRTLHGGQFDTLPAALRWHGYLTASLHTNILAASRSFGFDQTHSVLRPPRAGVVQRMNPGPFLMADLSVMLARGMRAHLFAPESLIYYRDAQAVNRRAEEWLDSQARAPFFLHLHYLDPHDPYYRHPYRLLQMNPRLRTQRDRIVEIYDGEILFVDQAIGELLEMFRARGLLANTFVVLTADHGEEFLEHSEWGHGNHLHSEAIRVPLVIAGPGIEAGVKVTDPVSFVDLAPTILGLVGIEPPEDFEGRDLFAAERLPSRVLAQLEEPDSEQVSWEDGHWKLLRSTGAETWVRLYDVESDPGELRDVLAEHPEVAERLGSELDAVLEELQPLWTAGSGSR